MQKINNNKFDIINYDVPKFKTDITFQYYKYDERTEDLQSINDSNLSLQINNNDMFLANKITIQLHDLKSRYKFDSNINFLNNIDKKALERIQSLQNHNLNLDSFEEIPMINYFNSNLKFDDKSINFTTGLNESFKRKILLSYDNNPNYSEYEGLTTVNQRNVSYSTNYLFDIIKNKEIAEYGYDFKSLEFLSDINQWYNEKTYIEYLTKNISVSNQSIDKFIDNKKSEKLISINNYNDLDDVPLLFKLQPFYISPIIEDENLLKNSTGVAFIGFLIKKHIKKVTAENDVSFNVASQFIYVNINDDAVDQITLYDGLLNYANSYAYEISPVFYVGLSSNGSVRYSFPIISHNLIYNVSQQTKFTRAVDYYTPEPPNGFQAKFIRNLFTAELSWQHPSNPQEDVIGFQIYRRDGLEKPFELIKMYIKKPLNQFRYMTNFSDFVDESLIEVSKDNSLISMYSFIDEDVNLTEKTYIYAVCSVDAHGYVSNYSTQIGLRYSTIYNSLIVDHVSAQNAPRTYPNLYIERKSQLFENDDLLFDFIPNFRNRKKIKIYFTPDAVDIHDPVKNQTINVFDINNQYQLSVTRLTDLVTKNIKFKLSLP